MAISCTLTKREFYNFLQKKVLSESQLGYLSYPFPAPSETGKALLKRAPRFEMCSTPTKRYCSRCYVWYNVDGEGNPLVKETCIYHHGRTYVWSLKKCFSCCPNAPSDLKGCCQWYCHVSTNFELDNLRGFVEVKEKNNLTAEEEYDVFALDCEMCYTNDGLVVCKVALIDWEGKVIYDKIIRPDKPVVDYNTRFSGVTAKDMIDVYLRLEDVQKELLSRFSKRTILVGHSLEHDLLALKLIHKNVVDTGVVFPHNKGLLYKISLKQLALDYLRKEIHQDASGHSSAEDAIVCIELLKLKAQGKI